MKSWGFACVLLLLFVTPAAITQTIDTTAYGGRQTFAAFFDYSNDSSHIALGTARDRKFTELGFQYEYRLKANRKITWKYTGEFRPLIAVRDVTTSAFVTLTTPVITETFYDQPTASLGCVAGSQTVPLGPET